jgi:hypothetical protein
MDSSSPIPSTPDTETVAVDTQIAREIEALRARFPQTRELYREVCALLFFRYGLTPTANRLYQYVRKGSMATPAQVLARFWSDLRERSRLRIDHPGLPPELGQAAGELVLQLWDRAQAAATRTYEAQAAEARAAVRAAEARTQAADDEVAAISDRLAAMGGELADSRAQSFELARQLATIQGRLASMTEMLRDQSDEMRELREELAIARRDVARAVGETNALRVQLTLARHRGSRKPLGGVPEEPDPGQENLALDPQPEPDGGEAASDGDEAASNGDEAASDGTDLPRT